VRDVVVFALFVTLLPACFLRPWFGLMTFTWLAYNRTQDLTWGFARSLPISDSVAIAMILGWLVWEFRPLSFTDRRLKAMLLLLVVIGIGMAVNTLRWNWVGKRYIELIKVIFVALLTASLLINRRRLRSVGLVISLALGFYGIKNGLHFLMGGGSIVGPGGMLADNNDFALAMAMNLPFLWYMSDEVSDLRAGKFLKYFMRWAFFMTMLTIMSTGSRGGFLSMGVVIFFMAMKTRYKIPALIGMGFLGMIGLAMAPAEYIERLKSITEAGDQSVQGRFIAWQVAFNMVKARPFFGIGFYNMVWEFDRYTHGIDIPGGKIKGRVAHNSYFQIWAETGSIALGLFLYMIFSTIFFMRKIARRVKNTSLSWIRNYSQAIEVCLYGYICGATFLNRAHFDMMYQVIAIATTIPLVMAYELKRGKPRRPGPGIAREVWVRHRDPFVNLPST
jgi:probable O-glycosylation ligase (exosortase A-associated)